MENVTSFIWIFYVVIPIVGIVVTAATAMAFKNKYENK